MSDGMIERVARTLNPLAFKEAAAGENNSATMQNYYAVICNRAREQARAAIKAMREPTEAMIATATFEWGSDDLVHPRDVQQAWRHMIDTVLAVEWTGYLDGRPEAPA